MATVSHRIDLPCSVIDICRHSLKRKRFSLAYSFSVFQAWLLGSKCMFKGVDSIVLGILVEDSFHLTVGRKQRQRAEGAKDKKSQRTCLRDLLLSSRLSFLKVLEVSNNATSGGMLIPGLNFGGMF